MKTGKKYGVLSKRLLRNLQACYTRANGLDVAEGLVWYDNANSTAQVIGNAYGLETSAVCGVIAALSPGRSWTLNVQDTQEFCRAWSRGEKERSLPKVGSYGWRNIKKAEKIARGALPLDVLGGNKVRAFFSCLSNPEDKDQVCIDRHAKSAAFGRPLGDREGVVRPAEYGWLAKHYIKLAKDVGILPMQYQAICWVTWRRLHGNLKQEDLF